MTRVATAGPTVAVVNRCSVLADADVLRVMDALQIQVDRDFSPVWDQGANLIFVPKTTNIIPKGCWQLLVEDTSPEADAAGFHLLTNDGYPIGHVFAKDSIDGGMSYSVTMSHELLELLVDPRIDQVRFDQDTGIIRALEVCDAVEDDSLGYDIDLSDGKPPVKVSAFQKREWFQAGPHVHGTTYSFPPGIVTRAFELASGGYIGIWECGKGWSQQLAAGTPGARTVKKATSRTLRRFRS
jgi:hypothetical protein